MTYRVSENPIHYFAFIQRQHQQNMSRMLRPLGISPQMWRVLAVLGETDAPCTIGHLAELTVLDRANLGRLLETMEEERLLRRSADVRDRRTVLVELLPAGRERLDAAVAAVQALNQQLFRGLDSDAASQLIAWLRQIKLNCLEVDPVPVAVPASEETQKL